MQFTDVILIALFIEAVVNALKPIWSTDGEKLSVSEYVSMGMGILLAVACKINMLAYIVDVQYPLWVEYVFYALTGIAIGRGTNFLYDLWNKLKEWQSGKLIENGFAVIDDTDDVDLEITNWSLAQLKGFCSLNGVEATGCETREDYISAIERAFSGATEPPVEGGAE